MATLEELKNMAEENGIELTDEMLDSVAGGAYDKETWDSMTPEERQAAQTDSIMNIIRNLPCALQ